MKKIDWLERVTTSTGKDKYNATVVDEKGVSHEGVTIWGDFPNFNALVPGSEVDGEIVVKQNGQYTNKTLYAPKTGTPTRSAGAITKAMDKKEASIGRFQENKEESIKISSTMRDAVLLSIAEGSGNLEEAVVRWRKWLWLQWDKTGTNDINPF